MSHQPSENSSDQNAKINLADLSQEDQIRIKKAAEVFQDYGIDLYERLIDAGTKHEAADEIHKIIQEENLPEVSDEIFKVMVQCAKVMRNTVEGKIQAGPFTVTPTSIEIVGRGKKAVDAEKNNEDSSTD